MLFLNYVIIIFFLAVWQNVLMNDSKLRLNLNCEFCMNCWPVTLHLQHVIKVDDLQRKRHASRFDMRRCAWLWWFKYSSQPPSTSCFRNKSHADVSFAKKLKLCLWTDIDVAQYHILPFKPPDNYNNVFPLYFYSGHFLQCAAQAQADWASLKAAEPKSSQNKSRDDVIGRMCSDVTGTLFGWTPAQPEHSSPPESNKTWLNFRIWNILALIFIYMWSF